MPTEPLSPRLWQLPPSLPDDLLAFEKNVAQFKAGTISPTQFQVFRVPQGVYEQRESGTYMLRVRFPAGVALPHQLRKLADVAQTHGNGVLHVTTRQDIQIHRVRVEAIHPALVALAEAGLSTKGGGGNTVRNIVGCPHAGVCANEAFDVTPHVLALTEFLLPDPQSFQLPRKFKVAFSGCGRDSAGATVNDVGLIAKKRDGIEGFTVWVGGGLGSTSRIAELLEEFVPASDVPLVVEAIKRVFNTHGNRKDRRQARLRFLIRQIGLEAFRTLYLKELVLVRGQRPLLPALQPVQHSTPDPAPFTRNMPAVADPAYTRWLATNVRPQKQSCYFRIELPLFLGDIPSDELRALADVVERHGEKLLRATQDQNFVLRWVRQDELAPLYSALKGLALGSSRLPVLRDLVACTGAANCRLGLCLSRGLAQGIADALSQSRVNLYALGELKLNISGCPNACGRHPIADIGLHGAARRVDGRLVPHYTLQFGGHVEEGKTVLASGRHTIPAHRVPAFIADLLNAFALSPQRPDFAAFLATAGGFIDELAAKHKHVPSFKEDRNFYYDWGAEEPFSLAGRVPGECGAGVLDLIEVDLKSAAEALQEKRYFSAAALAARALLVTRGEQAGDDRAAFALFQKHFIDAGLVNPAVQTVVTQGVQAAEFPDAAQRFAATPEAASALVATVQRLFKSMDATLQLPKFADGASCAAPAPATPAVVPAPQAAPAATFPADVTKDFRGVVCPLNYMKTSMALAPLKPGQVLAVILDHNGARNVPESARNDGHEIISVEPFNTAFRILIRKRRQG
ncbi:MAG: sulfurtransferase TusA family protein [Opitutaceae bacterium]